MLHTLRMDQSHLLMATICPVWLQEYSEEPEYIRVAPIDKCQWFFEKYVEVS